MLWIGFTNWTDLSLLFPRNVVCGPNDMQMQPQFRERPGMRERVNLLVCNTALLSDLGKPLNWTTKRLILTLQFANIVTVKFQGELIAEERRNSMIIVFFSKNTWTISQWVLIATSYIHFSAVYTSIWKSLLLQGIFLFFGCFLMTDFILTLKIHVQVFGWWTTCKFGNSLKRFMGFLVYCLDFWLKDYNHHTALFLHL